MPTAIEQRYIDLHPGSAARFAVAREIFPDGVTHEARRLKPFPLYFTHGEGPAKWDVDGNRILDYMAGHGALILGHGHPDIVAAVNAQMARSTHLSGSTDVEIEWAQWGRKHIPSAEKGRFHSSGTEADMMAIRMARAYTGKTKVIKFEKHFHGWSDYMAVDGVGTGGIPRETAGTMIVLPDNDISVVEKTLQEHHDVAAVILEPTGAHMGMYPIVPSFLAELREVTRRHGVVLIFDEVVTGFRTSKGGAQAYYGVTPDVTTLAKILAGGLPGGAVTGKAEIINTIEVGDDTAYDREHRIAHQGTLNANPLSAAAGATALGLIANTPVNDTADAASVRLRDGINDVLSRMEVPGCASGVSSMIFLRLGLDHDCDREVCIWSPGDAKKAANPVRDAQLNLALLNHGVQSGVRFMLTAAHTDKDVDDSVAAVAMALTEVRGQGLI